MHTSFYFRAFVTYLLWDQLHHKWDSCRAIKHPGEIHRKKNPTSGKKNSLFPHAHLKEQQHNIYSTSLCGRRKHYQSEIRLCVSPQVTNYSYIFRVSLEDDAMFVAVEFFHRKKCNLLRIFSWVYPFLPLQQVLQNRKFKQHN